MIAADLTPALAYLRGRSKSDRQTRHQRTSITAYAKQAGYQVLAEFWDAIPDDGDNFECRPGFAAALKRIEANGVHSILVATIDDFAGDRVTQEVAVALLSGYGIDLIAAHAPPSNERSELSNLVQQVLATGTLFEKTLRAAHLRAMSERARVKTGPKWRKTYAEFAPAVVLKVKRLHQTSQSSGIRITLREISKQLAAMGHLTKQGKPYHPETIRRMLKGPRPKAPRRRSA